MPKGVPNKRYTGEFKQEVVETMQREKLSHKEVARLYGITAHDRVASWERIYLEEGPDCTLSAVAVAARVAHQRN